MDILIKLSNSKVSDLYDFYENHRNYAPHVLRFLRNALEWDVMAGDLINIYAPHGNCLPDGTFIAVLQIHSYNLFMFTIDKSCVRLKEALQKTEIINWTNEVLIYALHEDIHKHVMDALEDCSIAISFVQECALWIRNHHHNHIDINCPDGFIIENLDTHNANVINTLWPYRYEGSEEYIKTLIKLNGGQGIFRKYEDISKRELVAWVLKNSVGLIGILQTKEEYQRMGLGTLVLKSMVNKMTSEALPSLATIAMGNHASHAVFSKCGFSLFAKCYYIGAGKSSSIAFDCNYDFQTVSN